MFSRRTAKNFSTDILIKSHRAENTDGFSSTFKLAGGSA